MFLCHKSSVANAELKFQTQLNKDQDQLLKWFEQNARPLPWRRNRNPYMIWISEVMLQQTTVTAVIPYFERFIKNFPRLEDLASAPLEKVYENWAGLGYYSRARNLHKAAQQIAALKQFPQTHTELLELPGFGPYTSRAVSSLGFDESVGVLDGNVIRVLCRRYGLDVDWWQNKEREKLQHLADQLVQNTSSYKMNQALMELGATVCTPQSPSCFSCPWSSSCVSLKEKKVQERPRKKPKKQNEIWLWQIQVSHKKVKGRSHYAFIENDYAPFLKGQLVFPGVAKKSSSKPRNFLFQHSITHHQIFVQKLESKSVKSSSVWLSQEDIIKKNPASLIQKVFKSLK